MKKQILLFLVLCLAYTTKSQISDRENDESTYLIGARPEAGNFGFFFGISTSEIIALGDSSWNEAGIPLINVKYYQTDKLVYKAGVQVWKKRRSIEGDLEDSDGSYKHVETDANWNISLGAEQHFDLSNIWDAYIGMNANVGYERSVRTTNSKVNSNNFRDDEGSSFGFTYGLETVIGQNIFIADLPLAVGFETGFSAKNYGANKYKYEWDEKVGGTSNSGTYYTSLVDDFEEESANAYATSGIQFSELKARRFDIMPIARVTITYYLKR